MVTVTFELPPVCPTYLPVASGRLVGRQAIGREDVLSSVRKDPERFARELRLAAAWYEMGLVSQSRAAEISGLSRSEFISALGRFEVSVFQYNYGRNNGGSEP